MAMYFYNRESELYHMMENDAYLCHYGIPGMKWGKKKLKEIKNLYEERQKYRIRNKRFKSVNKTAKQWAKNDKRVAKVERRVANRNTSLISELISPGKVSQTKNFNSSVMANRKAYEKALEEQKRQKEYYANKWQTDLRKSKNAEAIKNESATIQKYVDWDVEYYKKTGKKHPYKKNRRNLTMATKFLRHSDELYHYGVKGMKWHDHVYADDKKYQSKKGHEYAHDIIDDIFDANFKPISLSKVPSKPLSKKKTPKWHDPEQHTDPAVIRGEQRLKDSRLHAQVEEKEQYEREQYEKHKDEEKRKAMARDEAVRKAEKMRKLSNDARVRASEQARAERRGREAALAEQERQRRARNKKYLPGKSKKA